MTTREKIERQQILRVEKRAEWAVKNNISRDHFWDIMRNTYGYTLASIALERYDSIIDFLDECRG